jgi:hypothetical protein
MLLESKNFEKRKKIADEMERAFLERYFGSDPEIIVFAKSLINSGNKLAAKELNRVISVLGTKTDAKRIIQRVSEKFNIAFYEQSTAGSPPQNVAPNDKGMGTVVLLVVIFVFLMFISGFNK